MFVEVFRCDVLLLLALIDHEYRKLLIEVDVFIPLCLELLEGVGSLVLDAGSVDYLEVELEYS